MNTPAPVTFAVTVNEPGVTQTHTAALDPAQHDTDGPGLLLFGLASRALRALDLPAPALAADQTDAPTHTELAAALRDDMDTASSWDGVEDQDLREAAAALARAALFILRADAALETAAHRATDAGQGHRLRVGHSPAWRAIVDAAAPLAITWAAHPDDAEDVHVTDAAGLAAAVRRAMDNARAEASARPSSGGRHVRPGA